jgi:hypothetical protein
MECRRDFWNFKGISPFWNFKGISLWNRSVIFLFCSSNKKETKNFFVFLMECRGYPFGILWLKSVKKSLGERSLDGLGWSRMSLGWSRMVSDVSRMVSDGLEVSEKISLREVVGYQKKGTRSNFKLNLKWTLRRI